MIAHIVLFNAKGDVGVESRRLFARKLAGCINGIPSILIAKVGRSVDVDPGYARSFGDKTYDFAAVLEFADRSDLIAYLTHPLHDELGRLFWEFCESTTICEVEYVDMKDERQVDLLVN